MRKLITICVGLIVAGYATAAQPDEANAKIQELEKKVEAADAKIQALEKRLSAIENVRLGGLMCGGRSLVEIAEESQKPRWRSKPWLEDWRREREAMAADKETMEKKKFIDTKIDAFLKEYLGVQFGDSIDMFPEKENKRKLPFALYETRDIPVIKKFKYFDRAQGNFYGGKLCSVYFGVDINTNSYGSGIVDNNTNSYDSIIENIEPVFVDLAVSLGFESSEFGHLEYDDVKNDEHSKALQTRRKKLDGYSYRINFYVSKILPFKNRNGHMGGCCSSFSNFNLMAQIDDEERRKANATGETLPDP